MNIIFRLGSLNSDFEEGATDFLSLLRRLERTQFFDLGFMAEFVLWDQEAAYLERFRQHAAAQHPGEERFTMSAASAVGERVVYNLGIDWEPRPISSNLLVVETYDPHPRLGRSIDIFIETIDTVITWQRPQHVRCGPSMYFLNDHPLDKARSGIGWLGWVPFDLQPSEVPEAAILLPMQGGTFLASQRDWWIAAGPQRDGAAVQRAQALELRLNVLGVLPTTVELRRGDWGQGGVRP